MPKYVIERELPGAGSLSDTEICGISQKSNEVLCGMPDVQWVQSDATDDKIFCVYVPANAGRQVARTIDPTHHRRAVTARSS